jgi:hypothetical protein
VSNGSELKSPAAQALRAAGYKPLPRWWVTQDQLDLIAYMIRHNAEEVNRIRNQANRKTLTREQEIDQAWQDMKCQ